MISRLEGGSQPKSAIMMGCRPRHRSVLEPVAPQPPGFKPIGMKGQSRGCNAPRLWARSHLIRSQCDGIPTRRPEASSRRTTGKFFKCFVRWNERSLLTICSFAALWSKHIRTLCLLHAAAWRLYLNSAPWELWMFQHCFAWEAGVGGGGTVLLNGTWLSMCN